MNLSDRAVSVVDRSYTYLVDRKITLQWIYKMWKKKKQMDKIWATSKRNRNERISIYLYKFLLYVRVYIFKLDSKLSFVLEHVQGTLSSVTRVRMNFRTICKRSKNCKMWKFVNVMESAPVCFIFLLLVKRLDI